MSAAGRIAADRIIADRITADWIAADWGTSRLRVWAMGCDGRVRAEATSASGMGGLAPDAFEPALLALVGDWLGGGATDVVICGMAGARQGWIEAPYAPVPGPPHGAGAGARPVTADPRLRVHILPGLAQGSPPEVMRGEETQIAGLLAREPRFDGVACLPGTHSKWAHLSAGEVISFATFMTGELFALLSEQSVLRHSVVGDGWDRDDFLEAVDTTLSRPERLASSLFGIRAASLLDGLPAPRARARLSGLLIGAELAAARPYWLGREIVLIGASGPVAAYRTALEAAGAAPREGDATALTLAGLTAAHDAITAARTTP